MGMIEDGSKQRHTGNNVDGRHGYDRGRFDNGHMSKNLDERHGYDRGWFELEPTEMKGNEGPQSQNEEKQRPKGQKLEKIDPARKRTVFGNLWGGAYGHGRHTKKCYYARTTPREGYLPKGKS